jgi:hypothetical protein
MTSPYIFKSECININIEDYKSALYTVFIIAIVGAICSFLSCFGMCIFLFSEKRLPRTELRVHPIQPPQDISQGV